MLCDTDACVYLQQPNFYGNLEDAEATGAAAHEAGAKFILGIHPIAAAILKIAARMRCRHRRGRRPAARAAARLRRAVPRALWPAHKR